MPENVQEFPEYYNISILNKYTDNYRKYSASAKSSKRHSSYPSQKHLAVLLTGYV